MNSISDQIQEYSFLEVSKKKTGKAWNQFWLGFMIYTISYTLIQTGVVLSKIVYFQLLGVILFTIPATRLIKFEIKNQYLKNVYTIYLLWLLFVVLRGFSIKKEYLFNTLTDGSSGIFLYLAPLILLFPMNLLYLKKVVNTALILSVVFLFCDVIFIRSLLTSDSENGQSVIEYFSKFFEVSCGFILLIITYHNTKKKHRDLPGKIWVLFVLALTTLFALVRARRGLIFMSLNVFICAYIIFNYANRSNVFFKVFPIVVLLFLAMYGIKLSTETNKGPFKLIAQRLNEDSRSEVEDYFYLDLDRKDWIIGKGIAGMFYCPTGATEDGYRDGIETDYLTIILKGGVVSLGLLLLIAVPAILKGLFYSKNILSKACATWILLWMISLYPATVTTFSLNYLLVWISIGICYSKEMRNIPEDVMKKYFQYKIFGF